MSTTYAPPPHVHRRHINLSLVAVIALAAALVTVGAWVLIDRGTNTSQGHASSEVTTMLNQRIAAMNSGHSTAAAALYASNAVLEERDQIPAVVTTGQHAIDRRLRELYDAGLRLQSTSAPIQIGRYVGEAVRFYQAGGTGTGEGILVFEIDPSGKIAHQWVTGETRE